MALQQEPGKVSPMRPMRLSLTVNNSGTFNPAVGTAGTPPWQLGGARIPVAIADKFFDDHSRISLASDPKDGILVEPGIYEVEIDALVHNSGAQDQDVAVAAVDDGTSGVSVWGQSEDVTIPSGTTQRARFVAVAHVPKSSASDHISIRMLQRSDNGSEGQVLDVVDLDQVAVVRKIGNADETGQ